MNNIIIILSTFIIDITKLVTNNSDNYCDSKRSIDNMVSKTNSHTTIVENTNIYSNSNQLPVNTSANRRRNLTWQGLRKLPIENVSETEKRIIINGEWINDKIMTIFTSIRHFYLTRY